MYIPQLVTLPQGYRGASYGAQVNFWSDTVGGTAFDFTPWTVSFVWSGASPAITPSFSISGGAVIITMVPTATAAAAASMYHFILVMTAISGSPAEVEYLAHGPLTFTDA